MTQNNLIVFFVLVLGVLSGNGSLRAQAPSQQTSSSTPQETSENSNVTEAPAAGLRSDVKTVS
ncbi:MAG: hypothetical protein K2X47_19310, partial [Bdellovibrionales bacterium]|nr:hypothetical protein [Bdellovibrionales bacterium]